MEGQTESAGLASDISRLGDAVHDLCQPLTTLQCRLEMARTLNTDAAYREAVEMGLAECGRLVDVLESMRGLMRTLEQYADASRI